MDSVLVGDIIENLPLGDAIQATLLSRPDMLGQMLKDMHNGQHTN